MPDTAELAALNQIKNIEKNTGKTIDEWCAIARKSGFTKHGEVVKFLKAEYGMGHGNANLVADKAFESASVFQKREGDPADAWFAGKKADLRPVYDAVASAAKKLGSDVECAPKKTYMSLRRKKQFGCIMPATATRVDVGINLKNANPTKRLVAEKPGGMFTHRVSVSGVAEVDAELLNWLKRAY